MFYDENHKTVYKAKKHHGGKKRKNGKKKKLTPVQIVLIVCASVLVLVLATVGVLASVFKYNKDEDFTDLTESDLGINVDLPDTVTNIALFGIDARQVGATTGNTDSIMVLSIDNKHHTVRLFSILRDSLVEVNGKPHKINALYAMGGPQLAIKTINQLFGLDIRHYATINFEGMRYVIDAMGGIEVELTEQERINANYHMKYLAEAQGFKPDYIEKAGKQILNGMQACEYARLRKTATVDGENWDYGRTDRQRYVLEQLFNKALKLEKSKYPATIKAFLPYVQTSLGYSDIFSLAGILMTDDVKMEQAKAPMHEYVIDDNYTAAGVGAAKYYNYDYAKKTVHAFLYEGISPEEYIKTHPVDKSGWFTPPASSNNNQTSSTTASKPPVSSQPVSSEDTGSGDASSDVVSGSDVASGSDVGSADGTSSEDSDSTTSTDTPADSSTVNTTTSAPVTTTSTPDTTTSAA